MGFQYLTYYQLLTHISNGYKESYGILKFEKVQKMVQTSNKIGRLIQEAKQKRVVPRKDDYLDYLNSIPFFIFSKPMTLALGGLLALERWNIECNKNFALVDKQVLKSIANQILDDCGKMLIK